MVSQGYSPPKIRVPAADNVDNVFLEDVIGQKTDAPVVAIGTTATMVAYIKGLIAILGVAGIDDVVIPFGPIGQVSVDDAVDSAVIYSVHLINLAGDILTNAEMTPGTFVVHRIRAGADTEIISSTAATENLGRVTATIDFTTGNWAGGDLGYVEFTGITATVGGITTELPILRKSFRVSQEGDIEAKIDTIDGLHDVPSQDSSDNNQMRDVIGNKTDTAATGAVTATASEMVYLKQLVTILRAAAQRISDGTADGTAGKTLAAGKSVVDALGADGNTPRTFGFDDGASILGEIDGMHQTVHILFIIPEAVGSINADNAAILAALNKFGSVHTITQSDALTYPNYSEYNLIVCGQNTTPWTTSNLAHVKVFPGVVICVDATAAAFFELGTDGGNAASKTILTAISQIKANLLGIGAHDFTGLAVGANTVAAAGVTFHTLDMSNANITEIFYGTETTADNTDVILAAIFKRQPDGSVGVDETGLELEGTRFFYGCAVSFNSLNTLGQAVFSLVVELGLQVVTTGLAITLSGDIGDVETKIFGNQANEFNNGNPLVEYLTGRNTSGTRLPVGKSIYDLLGTAYVDGGGNFNLVSIADDLQRIGQFLMDGDAGGEAGSVLASGTSLVDMLDTIRELIDSSEVTGPFSYLDAGGEQVVVEDTATTRRRISVVIDLSTMTQDGTIRLSRRIDGSTYQIYDEQIFLQAGAENVFDYEFTTNQAWQLSYQEAVNEGVDRSIPFEVIVEVIE